MGEGGIKVIPDYCLKGLRKLCNFVNKTMMLFLGSRQQEGCKKRIPTPTAPSIPPLRYPWSNPSRYPISTRIDLLTRILLFSRFDISAFFTLSFGIHCICKWNSQAWPRPCGHENHESVDDRAWSESTKVDRFLVQSMRRGQKLIVTGISTPGNKIIDTYSLSGFTKALRLIDKSCS